MPQEALSGDWVSPCDTAAGGMVRSCWGVWSEPQMGSPAAPRPPASKIPESHSSPLTAGRQGWEGLPQREVVGPRRPALWACGRTYLLRTRCLAGPRRDDHRGRHEELQQQQQNQIEVYLPKENTGEKNPFLTSVLYQQAVRRQASPPAHSPESRGGPGSRLRVFIPLPAALTTGPDLSLPWWSVPQVFTLKRGKHSFRAETCYSHR